jgi:transposase
MCHRCQTVKKVLSLGERLFVCNACGHIEDRDLNAAKNIHQLGQAMPEVTPVESRALVLIPIGTKLNSIEAGTNPCALLRTRKVAGQDGY